MHYYSSFILHSNLTALWYGGPASWSKDKLLEETPLLCILTSSSLNPKTHFIDCVPSAQEWGEVLDTGDTDYVQHRISLYLWFLNKGALRPRLVPRDAGSRPTSLVTGKLFIFSVLLFYVYKIWRWTIAGLLKL